MFAALFQRKTDVFAVFVLIVQLVDGHFCLLNRRFFVYFCGIKRVCLWALLRGKTDAFATSFGRVCGVKRVRVCGTFSAQNGRVCDTFMVHVRHNNERISGVFVA